MKPHSQPWVGCVRFSLAAALISLGGCAGHDTAPSVTSQRWVVTPSRIATLSTAALSHGLATEIRFGGPLGRSALYLQFPPEWRSHGAPLRGFLTLSPRVGAPSDDSSVTLQAWRIESAWQPEQLQRWSDKPELAPPHRSQEIQASAGEDVRIDVSELLRFGAQHPERDFGIALIASGSSGHGLSFASGLSGGRAPRLEVYVR